MKKDYSSRSIGFVTEPPESASMFAGLSQGVLELKDSLSSKFQFFSSPTKPLAGSPVSLLKLAAATTALSSAAIALNPELAGAALGDIERGREAATSYNISMDPNKSSATKLGEFIGNFENEFNGGRRSGVNVVMQRYIHPPAK